jgi:hypothetical protein
MFLIKTLLLNEKREREIKKILKEKYKNNYKDLKKLIIKIIFFFF